MKISITDALILFIKLVAAVMVTSAIIHVSISVTISIVHQDLDTANMFNIIGLSALFPSLGSGVGAFWLSIAYCLLVGAIWLPFLIIQLINKKKSLRNTDVEKIK